MAEDKITFNGVKCNGLLSKIRKFFRMLRNRYYRWKLNGTSGVLKNGVKWRIELPKKDKYKRYLCVNFNDAKVSDFIMVAYSLSKCDFDDEYQHLMKAFHERLERFRLEVAEPNDPDGFFVKWITKKEQ